MKRQYLIRIKAFHSETKHKVQRIHPFYGTEQQAIKRAEQYRRKAYDKKLRQVSAEVFEVTDMRYIITV